jgi:tetrahydromethanopterin S-methyltransferase subunit F
MSDFWYGLIAGIVIGLAIGFIITRGKQKPWSELTEKEKRVRIWLIGAGVVLLAAGVVTALLVI